jgi:alkyl hydroperoxide reductase subunit F
MREKFAKDVVKLNELKEIEVDCDCNTSVVGIFAAGDVTNAPEKQIIVAAGEGAKAALSAYRYLIES